MKPRTPRPPAPTKKHRPPPGTPVPLYSIPDKAAHQPPQYPGTERKGLISQSKNLTANSSHHPTTNGANQRSATNANPVILQATPAAAQPSQRPPNRLDRARAPSPATIPAPTQTNTGIIPPTGAKAAPNEITPNPKDNPAAFTGQPPYGIIPQIHHPGHWTTTPDHRL